MGFAEETIAIFVEASLGTAGVDLLIGPKPLVPAGVASLAVIPYGGGLPEIVMNDVSAPGYVKPTAQIVARAPTWTLGMNKIQAAYNALFRVRNRFVSGTWWRSVTILQEPFPLGEDDNELIRFAFNFGCAKRPS